MTATGFDLHLFPKGEVQIDFLDGDGDTINSQVITREALARFPAVVHALFLAVDQGQTAALAFLDGLQVEKHDTHGGSDGTKIRSGDQPNEQSGGPK